MFDLSKGIKSIGAASSYRVRWTSTFTTSCLFQFIRYKIAGGAKSFLPDDGSGFGVDTFWIEFRMSTVPQFLVSQWQKWKTMEKRAL